MSIFKQLYNNSSSEVDLSNFIQENLIRIEQFINAEYSFIINSKDDVEEFILLKATIIENLDFSVSYNKAFIALLIEICERLNLRSSLLRIHSIFNNNNINIGSRLNASLLYLTNINTNEDYINKFNSICQLIENSINNEEDNINKPLATFINYYAYVVYNTQPHVEFSNSLKQNILSAIQTKRFHFLQNEIISKIISISLVDINEGNKLLQAIIDKLLGKITLQVNFAPETNLIEKDTEYAKLLEETDKSIQIIRKQSLYFIKNYNINCDVIRNSFGRGVNILTDEEQLVCYLKSFGTMHFAKLISAFAVMPKEFFNEKIEIIDWGCGQALASMTYLDYLNKNNIHQKISTISINEPSEIAIKRGALHIRKYSNVEIQTINKDLDSIIKDDFNTSTDIKFHLFSNILDIDDYNQTQLIELIEESFSGENYFVCVSPYINDLKTERLNSFQRYFEINYNSYQLIAEETNAPGNDEPYWNCNNNYNGNMNVYCTHIGNGCNKKWTRVLRIFKVLI